MEWGDAGRLVAAFVGGNVTGVVLSEIVKHRLERKRTSDERHRQTLRDLQDALDDYVQKSHEAHADYYEHVFPHGEFGPPIVSREHQIAQEDARALMMRLKSRVKNPNVRQAIDDVEEAVKEMFAGEHIDEAEAATVKIRAKRNIAHERIGQLLQRP